MALVGYAHHDFRIVLNVLLMHVVFVKLATLSIMETVQSVTANTPTVSNATQPIVPAV